MTRNRKMWIIKTIKTPKELMNYCVNNDVYVVKKEHNYIELNNWKILEYNN